MPRNTTREQDLRERERLAASGARRVHFGAGFTAEEWEDFAVLEVASRFRDEPIHVVLIGEEAVVRSLGGRLAAFSEESIRRVDAITDGGDAGELLDGLAAEPDVFVACHRKSADVVRVYGLVAERFPTRDFVYKIDARLTYPLLHRYDELRSFDFVASVFDDGEFERIYERSLESVPRKCEVRDAQDLYQLLLQVRGVPGAAAEFGSYRGHSGFIIAETLRRLGGGKRLYLCDTFDRFPAETLGLDTWWSGTHAVDFEAVRRAFSAFDFVTLVKGEFEATVGSIAEPAFSFVHVDCDAYRSVGFLLRWLAPRMSRGGVIAVEDYGHDWCLGARLACDEFLRETDDFFAFFSGFSGVMVLYRK